MNIKLSNYIFEHLCFQYSINSKRKLTIVSQSFKREERENTKGKPGSHGSELFSYLDVLDSTHVHPGLCLIWI